MIDWIFVSERLPKCSGEYLVSITKPINGSALTFKYVAYFDYENKVWHKCDSFFEEARIMEKIEFKVNAWLDNLSAFV